MAATTVTDPDGNELHGVKALTEQARQRREAVQARIDKAKDLKGTLRDVLTDWASRDLMIKRTMPQWSPWAISSAVFAIAAANEIAARLSGDAVATGAYTIGSAVALLGGAVAAIRARNRFVSRFAPRTPAQARWMALCAGVAMTWLTIAVMIGINTTTTPVLGLALVAATLVLARLHWRHHREPDPAATTPRLPAASLDELASPTEEEQDEDEDEDEDEEAQISEKAQYYLDQWANVVSQSNRLMPDTALEYEDRITTEGEDGRITTIGYRFRLYLPEDGITFSGAVNALGSVEMALHTPQKNLSIERIPEEICDDPAQVWFDVITHSPIQKPVPMLSTRYRCERDEDGKVSRGWIDLGPYANGDGNAKWTVYSGGDSMWSGLVIGGTGSGKTVVLDSMALSLAASDHTVLWYADGQRGSSSNFIPGIADYTALDEDGWMDMLQSLETIAQARAAENRRNGARDATQRGFVPTPERPGLVVIVDECQEILSNHKIAERWKKLTKIVRKVGISLIMATQSADPGSFGNSHGFREQLIQGNAIVLRTANSNQGNFLGMDLDPSKLPQIPGFGYLASGQRVAPFRSVFHNNYPKLWNLLGYEKTTPDEIVIGGANIATEGRYTEQAKAEPEAIISEIEADLQPFRDAARGHLDLVQAHKEYHPDPEQDEKKGLEELEASIEDAAQESQEIADMLAELEAETDAQAEADRVAEAVSMLGSAQNAALEAVAAADMEQGRATTAADLATQRDITRQRANTLLAGLVDKGLVAAGEDGYTLTGPARTYRTAEIISRLDAPERSALDVLARVELGLDPGEDPTVQEHDADLLASLAGKGLVLDQGEGAGYVLAPEARDYCAKRAPAGV